MTETPEQPNYDEAKIPPYSLPDPLCFENGEKVQSVSDWSRRRAEIVALFENQMAVPELRSRKPGTMTLISLAISAALVYCIAALLLPAAKDFFWELVSLIDIILLGHWMEIRSVSQASGALDALAKLLPDTAEQVESSGEVMTVPVNHLRPGDVVLVRPGASIPADGDVVEGQSDVNESLLTGETRHIAKTAGMPVTGGAINSAGSLRVRVTASGRSRDRDLAAVRMP